MSEHGLSHAVRAARSVNMSGADDTRLSNCVRRGAYQNECVRVDSKSKDKVAAKLL